MNRHVCIVNSEVKPTKKQRLRGIFLVSHKHPRSWALYESFENIEHAQLEHKAKYKCIIHPLSTFRIYYEIYLIFIYLGFIYTLFYQLALFNSHHQIAHSIFRALNIVDFIVIFFTGYINEKTYKVVLQPKYIAFRYLRTYFLVDILPIFPFATISVHYDLFRYTYWRHLYCVLICSKVFRMISIYEYSQNMKQYLRLEKNLWIDVFRFFICILTVVYMITSVDCRVTNFKVDRNLYSWISSYNLTEIANIEHFLLCYIRTSGLMLSIVPPYPISVPYEKIMSIICVVLGQMLHLFLAVIFLSCWFTNINTKLDFYVTINQMEAYIEQKRFPPDLKKKLLDYYNYKFKRRYFKENKIKNLLNNNLRNEIETFICRQFVHSVPLLMKLDTSDVNNLMKKMHLDIYMPMDKICQYGERATHIYFISRGTIATYTPSHVEAYHLSAGEIFGESALLINNYMRLVTAIAIEISEVYSLNYADFQFTDNKNIMDDLKKMDEERRGIRDAKETEYQLNILKQKLH
ncbi:potassium/sodium hyperpolarization-activated cyclic nucleotide-gated channel 2-like [Aethina tumida]|uniref:potassium/sodium hyperpolarization-activated cyclic nucleotide-gated channel 2-like n=1 Tax=Aethina tumida TaxID=116153 RepID=UPI002148DB74|nr:potassium/sodium hyperpolarization-activated cyclic nucleotide-gated channel 2-like [Aethina tumida]